jgi:hypothetical protein
MFTIVEPIVTFYLSFIPRRRLNPGRNSDAPTQLKLPVLGKPQYKTGEPTSCPAGITDFII